MDMEKLVEQAKTGDRQAQNTFYITATGSGLMLYAAVSLATKNSPKNLSTMHSLSPSTNSTASTTPTNSVHGSPPFPLALHCVT